MTKNKTIKWGIIGCGNVTEVKSGPAYQQTDGFELVAVMRRDFEKAKDYAKRHNVQFFYDDADALINNPEVDAIYIATPPDSHKFYALKVAEAGKPCCIEKPLSPSHQESLDICKAFKSKNTPLFTAYYRRSLPRFQAIKEKLDQGAIGDIRQITWNYCREPKPIDLTSDYNWRTNYEIAPGGYFDDLASHGLDLFAFLLGDFVEVKGIGINQQELYSSLDSISACWTHKSGITGTGCWNFGSYGSDDQVTIYGSKGVIKFSVFANNPLVVSTASGVSEYTIENPTHIQIHHVKALAECLIEGKPHPSTGLTALHTSWVMDQILKG